MSKEEVLLAFNKLINKQKAAGSDGKFRLLCALCIRESPFIRILQLIAGSTLPFFVHFVNALFEKGVCFFPEKWTAYIVLPLFNFKKGEVNNANNYRDISLSDAGSKVYVLIVLSCRH